MEEPLSLSAHTKSGGALRELAGTWRQKKHFWTFGPARISQSYDYLDPYVFPEKAF